MSETQQLPVDLDAILNTRLDELIQLPASARDIGGEILAILSRGLYTNPLDCIREYVQNAVDASASAVRIKLTGNSLLIFDDGHGMSFSDILLARQFGLSPKF